MHQKNIPIRGMHCRSCEILLEDAIGEVQGVKKIKLDHKKGLAAIEYGNDIPSENEIQQAIEKAGYSIGQSEKLPWITKDSTDWRLIVIGTILLVLMYLALKGTGLLEISLKESEVTLGFAVLLGLVAGVSTCMALVGGLILGVAARHAELHPEATSWQKFRPHLYFNLGRVLGYALLGGLLGILGGVLQVSNGLLGYITIVVGIIMIVLGIKLTNISPRIAAKSFTLPSSVARFFGVSGHQKEYSHKASMFTGALTFFIPCGFTQAIQLYAISTGDFNTGAIIMGAFALGTTPALLGIGGISSVMKGSRARLFFTVVGILVITFGAYNIRSAFAILPSMSLSKNVEQKYIPVQKNSKRTTATQQDVQVIKMQQKISGYDPSILRVKVGVPVQWIITSESEFSCASSIIAPSIGVQVNLKKGKNVIEFTPTKKGNIMFSCSMGMYRGKIIVE